MLDPNNTFPRKEISRKNPVNTKIDSNDKIGSIIRRQEALDFIEFVLKYPNLDS